MRERERTCASAWQGGPHDLRKARRCRPVNSRGSDLGSAIDVERLAGDVRRLVAAQERSRGGDVLGGPDPLDRVGLGSGGAEVLHADSDPARGVVGHLGRDEARRDRVDVDPELAQLERQRAGEALHSRLRGRVVGLAPVAVGRDAGEVEDLAVLLVHEGLLHGLAHQEGALEVHPHDGVPVVLGQLEQQVVAGDAGVVHQDVDTPELVEHASHGCLDGGTVGDVARDADGLRLATEAGCGGARLALVEVEDRDRGALLGEPLGGAGADPARCPRDDCYPSVESTHLALSSRNRCWPASLAAGHSIWASNAVLIRAAQASRSAVSAYLVRGQKKPRRPSPLVRGTTWQWRCGTDWDTVLLIATNDPSAASPSTMARESRWAAARNGSRSGTGRSGSVTTCARGMSRVCPLNSGRMSRNATKSSSLHAIEASVSPAAIRQNRQSGIRCSPVERSLGVDRRAATRAGEDEHEGDQRRDRRRGEAPAADRHELLVTDDVEHEAPEPSGDRADTELDLQGRVTVVVLEHPDQAAHDHTGHEVGEHARQDIGCRGHDGTVQLSWSGWTSDLWPRSDPTGLPAPSDPAVLRVASSSRMMIDL